MTRITRVEVIDENGRSYVNWDGFNDVQLSYQDGGRTLKVFVNKVIDPIKEAFKRVYGGYPVSCDDQRFILFREGYIEAAREFPPKESIEVKKSLYQFLGEYKYGVSEDFPNFDNDEFGISDWTQIFIDYLYECCDIISEDKNQITVKINKNQLKEN
jgi:hypothetical protein